MIIKTLFRFVTTAVLCLAFYSLGQVPGAPSVKELYEMGGKAVSRVSDAPVSDMAADVMQNGRDAVASVFSSDTNGPVEASYDNSPNENTQQYSTQTEKEAIATNTGIPICW